jgi:hypothetical protein
LQFLWHWFLVVLWCKIFILQLYFFLAGCTREDPNRNEKILLLVLCWLFVRHGELAQILAIVVLLVRRSCSRQEKLVFVDASEICTLGNEKNA